MALFGSVQNAMRSVVQSTAMATVSAANKPLAIDRTPAGPVAVPLPRPVSADRDSFEQLPRPQLELGARADTSGLHASLDLKVGARKLELASFSAQVDGVKVTATRMTAESTQKRGMGVSTEVSGDTFGAHFKNQDGPATLGAVSMKAGGEEVSVGLVPAAPSPIPVPVYAGKERK